MSVDVRRCPDLRTLHGGHAGARACFVVQILCWSKYAPWGRLDVLAGPTAKLRRGGKVTILILRCTSPPSLPSPSGEYGGADPRGAGWMLSG